MKPTPTQYQRNAFIPSLLAAVTLFTAPFLLSTDWYVPMLFVVSILALIVAWFTFQAKHWWWVPVFVVIAVLWNPVYPLRFTGSWWTVAQPVAAVLFLVAGAMAKSERPAGDRR